MEDASGWLGIEEILSGDPDSRFVPAGKDYPSFGYTRSAYWIRLKTRNQGYVPIRWLLELDTPHMDIVELYIPGPRGDFSVRTAGDTFPFREREFQHRNLFSRSSRAGCKNVLYALQNRGLHGFPHLRAVVSTELYRNDEQGTADLWIFYSFIFIMACDNLYMFFSIRKLSYLHFSLFITSYLVLQWCWTAILSSSCGRTCPWWPTTAFPFRYCAACSFRVLHATELLIGGGHREGPRDDDGLVALDCAGIVLALILPMQEFASYSDSCVLFLKHS